MAVRRTAGTVEVGESKPFLIFQSEADGAVEADMREPDQRHGNGRRGRREEADDSEQNRPHRGVQAIVYAAPMRGPAR